MTTVVIGRGIGLVSATTLFLLDAANAPLAERAWSLMEAGASPDELLEAISATGLRSLGSFALAQIEHVDDGSVVRIVTRGEGVIDVAAGDEQRTFAARGVRTWLEDVMPYGGSIVLRLDEIDLAGEPFRIGNGLVPAIALARFPVAAAPALQELTLPDGEVVRGLVPCPESSPPAEPPQQIEPVTDLAPPPTVDLGVTVPEAAEQAAAPDEAVQAAPTAPSLTAFDPEPALAPPDPRATIARYDANRLVDPSATILPGRPADAADDDDYDYDSIYGRTVMRRVSDAAVHPAPDTEPGAPAAAGMIEGVPAAAASSALGDHDGRTISRAQLAAMRAGGGQPAPAEPVAPTGPTVQAVLCASGHPNPPHAAQCRGCGQVLATSQRVMIPRPMLGRLRFGDGTDVMLDRPALIGRNPRIEGQFVSELPQVVRLDLGQGLSRTHAAVRLEGWQVYIEDLNSANGTVLTLPGRAPRRLHAGEPALVEHGALVDFGGEVTCTFEQAV